MALSPGTRGDGLRLQVAAADLVSMRFVGTLAGVVVLAVAARCGTGSGRIIAADPSYLSWQAPGSATPGTAQDCSADGSYLLEDGEDASKWVRVQVYTDYLKTGEAAVYVADSYNALGPIDVTAPNALAGIVTTNTYTLKNVSTMPITSVVGWIDAASTGLQISKDGVSFYAPTSEADPNALTWATIAAGASVNLYLKRTISAASSLDPKVLNALQFAWTGL